MSSSTSAHIYAVCPRKDHRGVDLISDALPFGRLRSGEPNAISNAIGYAKHRSRSHHAVVRVYDEAGNMIETHEQAACRTAANRHPNRRLPYRVADRALLKTNRNRSGFSDQDFCKYSHCPKDLLATP